MIYVSTPRFSWSLIQIRPQPKRFDHLHIHHMQIRAVITEISLYDHNLLIWKDKCMIFVSIPRFSGSLIQIRLKPKRFAHLHIHNMQIKAAITKIPFWHATQLL